MRRRRIPRSGGPEPGPAATPRARPPRLLRWLVSRTLTGDAREVVAGDLEEIFAHELRARPRWRAYVSAALNTIHSILAVRLAQRPNRPEPVTRPREHAMTQILHEWTHGLRALRRRPFTSVLMIGLLAIGVGASASMWTVVRSVIFSPLPYEEPERLGLLRISIEGVDRAPSLSAPELVDFRERSRTLQDIAAMWTGWTVLRPDDGEERSAQRLRVGWITANLLPLLGEEPLFGRNFTEVEEQPNSEDAVLLSHRLWVSRFGADPDILGRVIRLESGAATVIGVMPADFRTMLNASATNDHGADLWIPNTYWVGRDVHWLRAVARLQPGVSWDQARAEVAGIGEQLNAEFPEYAENPASFHLDPLHGELVRGVRPALTALSAMALILLLVAVANAAALRLTSSESRGRELATRAALGATRQRLLRGLLAETLPLGLIGGALAVVVAYAVRAALVAARPEHLPRIDELHLDGTTVAFALGLSVLVALLTGVGTAMPTLTRSLRRLGRRSAHVLDGRQPGQAALLAGQIAMAMVLLVGAGLLVRSVAATQDVDLGFDTEGVTAVRLNIPVDTYDSNERRFAFLSQLETALEADDSIASVGAINILPLSGSMLTGQYRTESGAAGAGDVDYRFVSEGTFDALGARFVTGRSITSSDIVQGRRVVVVDDLLAERLWPAGNAIGRSISVGVGEGADLEPHEVIGVLEHLRSEGVRELGRPQVYMPYGGQTPTWLAINGSLPVGAVTARIRSVAAQIDPEVPIDDVRAMSSFVRASIADLQFATSVLGGFALVALLLLLAGTYGVLSCWVSQRVPVVGLRIALGARPEQVVGAVLQRGLLVCAFGVVCGLAAAFALTHTLSGLLFETSPLDPATIVGCALGLLGIVFVASLLPARRAARIDPVTALRTE